LLALSAEVENLTAASSSSTFITAKELCSYILHTVYLGSENSSVATRRRASLLSSELGGYHSELEINAIIGAILNVFSTLTGGIKVPR
jgi:NAD+ synthase (glutamine-hydrolysing)